MRDFVTGATGFVGGALARKLRERGHEVRALARDPQKAGGLKAIGVVVFRGDITDKESMREAMSGADGVFHAAGWYKVGVRDKSGGEKVNIRGTRNVLELMEELNVPKGVYTSTLAINEEYQFNGDHISEYDAPRQWRMTSPTNSLPEVCRL